MGVTTETYMDMTEKFLKGNYDCINQDKKVLSSVDPKTVFMQPFTYFNGTR
jgi:hypothetical protein